MSPDYAALLTLRLASLAVIINCLEILASRADYGSRGIYCWEVISTAAPWTARGWRARLLDPILGHPGFLVMVAALMLAALILAADLWPGHRFALITAVLLGWLLVHLRLQYGLDGSDQMLTIVLAGMWVYHATTQPPVRATAMGFIAFQLILSYVTAGVAKLLSPEWRSGLAMQGIMRTRSYGTDVLARVFRSSPALARATARGVIAFECVGFVAVFIDPRWCLWFIGAGLAFHLSIAVFMGLNCFLWSFASTFPSVLVISETIAAWRAGAEVLAPFR